MAEAEKLSRPEMRLVPSGRIRIDRLIRWIISCVALWLIAMSGSIWWSGVPHAGWKATVLAVVGLLFLGGWSIALGGRPRAAAVTGKPADNPAEKDKSALDRQRSGD